VKEKNRINFHIIIYFSRLLFYSSEVHKIDSINGLDLNSLQSGKQYSKKCSSYKRDTDEYRNRSKIMKFHRNNDILN